MLWHQERPRGSKLKTSTQLFQPSQTLWLRHFPPEMVRNQNRTNRWFLLRLWFKATPTWPALESFYFLDANSELVNTVGSESVHVALLLCQRSSQRFSFSRCWSSSPLACCSLPQLEPSQQPQLWPIWRPSEESYRRPRWEEDPVWTALMVRLGFYISNILQSSITPLKST